MAEAAIIYFLRRLGYQLIQEGNVLSGVQDEIEWIKKEFQAMVAFLRDADKRQLRDETVAGWVKEDVLKNILFGVIASSGEPALDFMSAMDEGWLLERTNDYLQDKKYLLVLDDIWDENLWEELKHAFPRRKGRIIITTRIHGIASLPEDNFQIYDLQPLHYELAWRMFCKKAFRSSQGTCPDDLKEFAEAVVRKCGGLPLAIVAIGGLLSCNGRNSRVWQSVLDTLDWEFNHHRDIERLNKTLLFSYNHLPFYLKYCFLYPSLLPEAYEIGRKSFMIQAVTIHARDVVKACKLHDLMRDVANQMLKEERFGSILEEVDKTIQERQRRLVIYEDVDSIPSDISKLNVRSHLMFRVNELSFSALQKLLRQLKLVRVLDLQHAPLEKLPNEIGNLMHLRYLDLRGTLINDLPKSVKNLRNLRTLDVRNTEVKHLPAGINELQHLRHLLLSSFRDRENGFVKMDGDGKHFVKLQTLSGIESDEDLVKQLRNLTSLRKLYIGKMTQANSGDFCQSLERMTKLRSLTVLSESPLDQSIKTESLTKSTKNLEKLKTPKDPFPILGKLPSLAILTLASSAYKNSIVNFPPGGFPKLKLLRILGMENWTTWMPIEKGSMPEIQFLLIADCPRLTSLPDGFNHLTSLDDLTFMGMSLVFAHKLQKRDKWKTSHVKEVSIISEVNGQIVKEKLNTPHVN
ncbi:putative disease resistance protein [Capsicum galapagoense]